MKRKFNTLRWAFIAITLLTAMFANAQKAAYSTDNKTITVYVTAKNTNNKLTQTETLHFTDKPQPLQNEVSIFVDPSKTFQTMLGIGGALTDASAEVYAKLSKEKQKELLTAYYNKENGIGYTLGRTNIQSCDFSSDTYSYVKEGDLALKTFDISHDKKYRIPFIKDVLAATGGKLTLFASPWSPPAWMKTNNNALHGGSLKPEAYQSWANLYGKFIKAYEKEGIPIWGITVQNEEMAKQSWESCIYTAEQERDFIKNFLGPAMQKSGLASKKILIWDHNRDLMYQRVSTVLEDPQAAKYVWGVAYHWYEDLISGSMDFENERLVAQSFPNKPLMLTEGCAENFDPKFYTDWDFGEKYGQSMINDFNIGTVAWTDWNILLDDKGGPNHVGNFCMAPIHMDSKTGELIYTNAYYYLGHFSKFIRPGAKRIVSSASRNNLLTTAYQNPDGKIAVVVMNPTDKNIDYFLWIKGKAAKTTSIAHSIATLVID
ncbi:glycoside hydrolase family 30 beta sandwich domain-containing protein [Mucilaginibacter sp. L196]|uniref:glycoside hydrolase family 30 protein n=1 Tax=Mucilaginibacter sp. L196 TaxID=1641870 RepID=UPI00131C9C02|nr:glycoside hydrolase family 30 protein [Mucilaginibacter sp. L196]